MPYDRVATFLTKLRQRESFSRLALEFLILTAARSGEVRECGWHEIDLEAGLWSIPKERMKASREHVVPLTKPALQVLRRCAELRQLDSRLVFPGTGFRSPMSDMSMSKLLKMIGEPYTVHGFRSAFRDWVSEETSHASDIAEAALAHAIGNNTEAAYRRDNLLEKRRIMMAEWANYVRRAA